MWAWGCTSLFLIRAGTHPLSHVAQEQYVVTQRLALTGAWGLQFYILCLFHMENTL